MQFSPKLKGGVMLAGALSAAIWLRAQAPAEPPAAPSKEAAPPKEAPVRAVGLPPRPAPTDYQAHVQAGMVTLAADFHGHNITTEEAGPYTTEDFIAVEAAVFGQPGAKLQISPEQFSLRVNGKKTPLDSQSYLNIFHSLKDPAWEPTETEKNKGKTSINTGGGGGGDSLPPVVHMPMEMRHAMEQRVIKSSFPEGDRALPQSGLLFFEYHGQTKGIRTIELTYNGPAGKATLALQP